MSNISNLWLTGGAAAATFLLYGAYLHAFFRWSASVETIEAMARLAMHDTARDITVSKA
ncbi:MAG: hypothetical protein JF611_11585 [Betaproteobacteria bacterium]|nr:hypothetical protein [Betaproteobacteria bacterium]